MLTFTKLLPRFDNSTGSGGLDLSASNDVASKAISTGTQAINSFDPTQTAGAQKQNLGANGLGGLLSSQTGDYVKDYAAAVAKNPTVSQLYEQGNAQFNVPQLAQNATNLTNRVNNIIPAAYGGARGFDIGATDINNGAAQSSAYLTPQANAATANYNTAAGLASQYVTAGQAQNQQNLLPIQAEAPLLAQQEAAQATGWNQASQSEFDGLVQKMQAGVTLSTAELARANALAQVQEAYQQAVNANATAVQTANIGNQFKTLSPAQTLVNTFTGKSQRAV